MGYYTKNNMTQCIATGVGQLTDFTNSKVKLATAECIATDRFRNCVITFPKSQTETRGVGTGFVQTRSSTGGALGRYAGLYDLQTAQFGYWIWQSCSTQEGTPASYNTHTITLNSSVTPLNFGLHAQSKLTDNNLYWDLLGILPVSRSITCSERQWIATQTINLEYAYLQTSGDDITKTEHSHSTEGSVLKNWGHCVTGGLGAAQTALTINSGSTECDITGFTINQTRERSFFTPDSDGYYTKGEVYTAGWEVLLDVIPTGDMLTTILETNKEDYSGTLGGDLALTFSIQNTTNDKITYTFNTLYLESFDWVMDRNTWVYKQQIRLVPFDNSSTMQEVGIDNLNNDHYENP